MILLLCILVVCLSTRIEAIEFEIANAEANPVWVGIQGYPGFPHLENGGFVLNQGENKSITASDNWAGRFWGRTWCDSSNNCCLTGDCDCRLECKGAEFNLPATCIEIDYDDLVLYDITLNDGFNLKVSIEPIGGQGDGTQKSCTKAACEANILDVCPDELRVKNGDGQTIACASACFIFDTDEYCCRGNFSTQENCDSSNWPVDYPQFFADQCPDAYSYIYDGFMTTFSCNAPKYVITFGAG